MVTCSLSIIGLYIQETGGKGNKSTSLSDVEGESIVPLLRHGSSSSGGHQFLSSDIAVCCLF